METTKKIKLISDLGMIQKNNYKVRYGIFECFCGKQFKSRVDSVKRGTTKSCGCLRVSVNKKLNTIHNISRTKLYKKFYSMKARCYNKDNSEYKNYGARGIKICDEWLNNVKKFYDWALENGYKENLSIDRINNDGNYEPNNCRWANKSEQGANKRIVKRDIKYKGVYSLKNSKRYMAQIKYNKKRVYLGMHNTEELAAKAYNDYIDKHSLPTTKNII